jgi:hypothetical protein
MGTRSRIGIEGEDGAVRSVYCHWDGSPDGVGAELLEHYNSAERVIELQRYGDLSSIDGPDFAPEGQDRGGTVAYARWRGETDVDPRDDASRAAYRREGDWDIEYFYLYGPRGWEVAKGQRGRWRRLG